MDTTKFRNTDSPSREAAKRLQATACPEPVEGAQAVGNG